MGWFLTRKKSKPAGRSRAAAAVEKWDRQRTIEGLKWLASAAILIGLVLGWKHGQRALTGYASERGRPVAAENVELVDCPLWIHADVQSDLRWLASGYLTADPLSRTGLDEAHRALAANPWIESVHRIERTRAGLSIHATFRMPAAVVMLPRKREHADDVIRATDRYYVVDRQGIRLPTDSLGQRDVPYTQAQLKEIGLPVIVGVAAPAPPAGQVWPGEDLQAGLSLSKLLWREPYADQIAAYDVSGRDTRKRIWLSLRTKTSGTVWWGLPPGQERSIEREAKVKMQWLSQISASRVHRFQIDSGGRTVTLYTEVPTIMPVGESTGDPRMTGGSIEPREAIHRARFDGR